MNKTAIISYIDANIFNNVDPLIRGNILKQALENMATMDVRASGTLTDGADSPNDGALSIDFVNRKLYDTDGTTQRFSWNGGIAFNIGSDATGDMYFRGSSGKLCRLGIGTSGQYIGVRAGIPTWGNVAADLSIATGTLQASQFPAMTGDVTSTAGSLGTTLATVNSNVGTFGSAGSIAQITVNAKGLVTAASSISIVTNSLSAFAPPTGDLSINSHKLTSLSNPTNPQDAATKYYVDSAMQGLQIKQTATVATTGALATNTYNNGTAGVGATITYSATGAVTIDGHVLALNDYVLVKNEATAANNGLYLVTTAGATGVALVLTRATDMDATAEFSGAFIPVGNVGTANANSLWLCNPSGTVTVGTTAIPFTQLNGATDLTAGTGINITGNTISISTGYTGQTSLTTLGTVTTGTWGTGAIIGGATMTLGSDGTGDIYYRNSSGVLTRLGVGSNGTALQVLSGIPGWSSNWGNVQNFQANGIASAPTDRVYLQNTTAATSIAVQFSPAVNYGGSGWLSTTAAIATSANARTYMAGYSSTSIFTIGSLNTDFLINGSYTTVYSQYANGHTGINTSSPGAYMHGTIKFYYSGVTFTGSGLNDCTVGTGYTNAGTLNTATAVFTFTIDGVNGAGTTTLGAGGSSYIVGDTGTINGGSVLATYTVTSVSGGAVTGYTINTIGSGYSIASSVATTKTSGSGSGFTVNVTVLQDTFKYQQTGSAAVTQIPITGSSQSIGSTGITVTFGATTGHTLTNSWARTWSKTNAITVTGLAGNTPFMVGNSSYTNNEVSLSLGSFNDSTTFTQGIYMGVGTAGVYGSNIPFISFGTSFANTNSSLTSAGLTGWATMALYSVSTNAASTIYGPNSGSTAQNIIQFAHGCWKGSTSYVNHTSGTTNIVVSGMSGGGGANNAGSFRPSSGTGALFMYNTNQELKQTGTATGISGVFCDSGITNSSQIDYRAFYATQDFGAAFYSSGKARSVFMGQMLFGTATNDSLFSQVQVKSQQTILPPVYASNVSGMNDLSTTGTFSGSFSANHVYSIVIDGISGMAAVSVNTAGTGYVVNDVVTVSGGSVNPTLKVTSVSSGAVTGLQVLTPGSGLTQSTNYNTTGGTGTGLVIKTSNMCDSFKWNYDGGSFTTQVSLGLSPASKLMNNGVSAFFANTLGHSIGDTWTVNVATTNPMAIYNASGTLIANIGALGDTKVGAVTYANLPATPSAGTIITVTDATVNTWGTTISAGGGSNTVLAFYNGTAWTVAAK
jgi:hypothetical protein